MTSFCRGFIFDESFASAPCWRLHSFPADSKAAGAPVGLAAAAAKFSLPLAASRVCSAQSALPVEHGSFWVRGPRDGCRMVPWAPSHSCSVKWEGLLAGRSSTHRYENWNESNEKQWNKN